jgi:hypothetical protein
MSPAHDCDWAVAVLTGEAPPPAGDPVRFESEVRACPECSALAESLDDIDTLAASLPELTVPAELSQRTLGLVLAEMDRPAPAAAPARPVSPMRRRLLVFAGGLSIAAAALLVIWPDGPSPAPPERLVARGNQTALPTVSLKVAIDDGQALSRHRRDQAYPAGTRVQFRVGLDQPAEVALLRVDDHGVQEVTRASLHTGDHDLQLGSAPLAWQVEPGEQDAHFVVLAGPEGSIPPDVSAVVRGGSATVDDTGPCARVTALACDERLLRVSP